MRGIDWCNDMKWHCLEADETVFWNLAVKFHVGTPVAPSSSRKVEGCSVAPCGAHVDLWREIEALLTKSHPSVCVRGDDWRVSVPASRFLLFPRATVAPVLLGYLSGEGKRGLAEWTSHDSMPRSLVGSLGMESTR